MAYTPVELTKDGKTTFAMNIEEEVELLFDGWVRVGAVPRDDSQDVVRRGELRTPSSQPMVDLQAAYGAPIVHSRGLPRSYIDKRFGDTIMATPPTITVGADNTTTGFITSAREYVADGTGAVGGSISGRVARFGFVSPALSGEVTPPVLMKGGQPSIVTTGGRTWLQPYISNLTGDTTPQQWTAQLLHYGQKIAFGVRASSYTTLLFKVNGQYASLTPTVPGTSTALRYVLLDFGSVDLRDIEVIGGMHLGRIQIGPTDTIAIPDRPRMPQWYACGDSFFGATGASSGFTGMVQRCFRWLGVDDYAIDAEGGTGFLKTNGSSPNYLTRLQYALPTFGNCDGFLLSGSVNDSSFTQQQVQDQAAAVFDYIRGLYPNAPIVVPVFQSVNPVPAGQATALAGFQAAASTRSGVYVLNLQDSLTGTGLQGALTGSGNSDVFRYSDGTHPTQAGHDYYGKRIARMIESVVPGYASF